MSCLPESCLVPSSDGTQNSLLFALLCLTHRFLEGPEKMCVPFFVHYLTQDPSDHLVHEDGEHVLSAPSLCCVGPLPLTYLWENNFGLEAVRRPQLKPSLCY